MPRKTRGQPALAGAPSEASMRPRPDAAENRAGRPPRPRRSIRFNEAAARCRGKRAQGVLQVSDLVASMRPRPDAAENFPSEDWDVRLPGLQ